MKYTGRLIIYIRKKSCTILLWATMLCFVLSTLTGNYSQVDKLWSLIPVVYMWIIATLVFFLIIETVADQQQWNFHKEKNRLKKEGLDLPEYYR